MASVRAGRGSIICEMTLKKGEEIVRKIILGLVMALIFSVSTAFAQQARQDFTLLNKTGYDIREIYVSPTQSRDWGADIIGTDMLVDGNFANVTFNRNATACRWDLKVVYDDDGSEAIWNNIDLCRISKITIRYNRKSDTTSATFD